MSSPASPPRFRLGRFLLTLVGAASLAGAIWFGLVWTGHPLLVQDWVRAAIAGGALGLIALVALIRAIGRRLAARRIEKSLVRSSDGDGAILAQRMKEALATLKKRGRSTYLYDLPWYIIIGPPGAGKTTALVHSGLEFPGTDKSAIQGFGGTRNCDFWFAENAVLIDTAGRYTTQDSDAQADRNSWQAFLGQLKRARPTQPINGVLLAFSCEDMIVATPESLDAHAAIVRQRLAELQGKLRIDVPVYVIFTKADKIAGFREFFGSFDEARRRKVWGVTFQTRKKKTETFRSVAEEHDALVARLTAEVTDRLCEEPDSAARIAIFTLPGQMAFLQQNVSHFLTRVFENARDTKAFLRGFYFTSGTQEGTPIDQVLGTLGAADPDGGLPMGLMSGQRGKSYFLHDLLTDVVFAERDWVGFDNRSMRIRAAFRGLAKTTIAVISIALLGLLGFSFWQNATLVRQTHADARAYEILTRDSQALSALPISDPDPVPTLPALALLRDLPAGYRDPQVETQLESWGLSRRASLHQAATKAYSDGLERHLRPRMMLHFENQLPRLVQTGTPDQIFNALKVYLLLAKGQPGKAQDDAILQYFDTAWHDRFQGADWQERKAEAMDHIRAMLDLDDRVTPLIAAKGDIVLPAQQAIARMTPAERVFSNIRGQAAGAPALSLSRAMDDPQIGQQLRSTTGAPLSSVTVPGLFTHDGFNTLFLPVLDDAVAAVGQDGWVLGDYNAASAGADQSERLRQEVLSLYQRAFAEAWTTALDGIGLQPLSAQPPQYPALRAIASPETSAIGKLAAVVDRETRLSRGADGAMMQDIAAIEQPFAPWHRFAAAGADGSRPADTLIRRYDDLWTVLNAATTSPDPVADPVALNLALSRLMQDRGLYPDLISRFVSRTEREFIPLAADAKLGDMQQALDRDVVQTCQTVVAQSFPFVPSGPHLPIPAFEAVFGGAGKMASFFRTTLQPYVTRDAATNALTPDTSHPIGQRLSGEMLDRFDQAATLRRAFFPRSGARASVRFSVRPSEDLLLMTGTQDLLLRQGGAPRQLTWPQDFAGEMAIALPDAEDDTALRFAGDWAIIAFIRAGTQDQTAPGELDVTHDLDGRPVTLRLIFDTPDVPFTLPELTAFACPERIEP